MSKWTHVAATIRIDGIRSLLGREPDLGSTCEFDSPRSDWDACDVPRGSEGSLQHSLYVNPQAYHLAAYVVTIWGDLRDYEDVGEILAYLERVTKDQLVRQGIAHVEVEGGPSVVYSYDSEAKKWRHRARLDETWRKN
jgi:hypothetical protein